MKCVILIPFGELPVSRSANLRSQYQTLEFDSGRLVGTGATLAPCD